MGQISVRGLAPVQKGGQVSHGKSVNFSPDGGPLA